MRAHCPHAGAGGLVPIVSKPAYANPFQADALLLLLRRAAPAKKTGHAESIAPHGALGVRARIISKATRARAHARTPILVAPRLANQSQPKPKPTPARLLPLLPRVARNAGHVGNGAVGAVGENANPIPLKRERTRTRAPTPIIVALPPVDPL